MNAFNFSEKITLVRIPGRNNIVFNKAADLVTKETFLTKYVPIKNFLNNIQFKFTDKADRTILTFATAQRQPDKIDLIRQHKWKERSDPVTPYS